MSETLAPSHFSRTVIRASAGTGKTFQLSNRYLGLLNAGVAPDQILATTFTRKAAAEILDRIVVRLAEAASDRQACKQLGEFIGDPSLTCERCCQQLAGLLRGLHRLQVSTLDSFFGQMARSVSLEVGLSPAWKIVDQLQDTAIRDEAIEAVIHGEETKDLLTLTHLLTMGEASRTVGQLIRTTVNDLQSLFQETDADAWHALKFEKPLSDDEFVLLVEDLRTLAMPDNRFVRARDEDYTRALLGDWESFISKGLAAKVLAGESTYYKKPIPDAAIAIYKRLLKHARSLLLSRIAMQTEGSYDLLKKFDAEYSQLKREQHASRFDDITRFLARSLRDSASQPQANGTYRQLSFRLDANIHHLLLDEFQDTAPAQWDVLRPFAKRVTSGEGSNSFFCVGDTKQAIYGWRGGVAEIFDAIGSELTGLDESGLNTSFRSSEPVIETVNEVFEHAAQHSNLGRAEAAVRAWCQRFERHTTMRGDLPGYVALETAPDADELLEFAAPHARPIDRRVRGVGRHRDAHRDGPGERQPVGLEAVHRRVGRVARRGALHAGRHGQRPGARERPGRHRQRHGLQGDRTARGPDLLHHRHPRSASDGREDPGVRGGGSWRRGGAAPGEGSRDQAQGGEGHRPISVDRLHALNFQ